MTIPALWTIGIIAIIFAECGLLIGFFATCLIVLAALFASWRLPTTSSAGAAPQAPASAGAVPRSDVRPPHR